MSDRIRILIVDDQTLVREGFRKLLELEPDFKVVGTAENGGAALQAMLRLEAEGSLPGVVLMDIRMPHMGGIEATREIKARWPASAVVILTTFDDVELIQEGLRAGALGYSLKDITAEQLSETVRTASKGQVLLQPNIATKVFASITAPATPASESEAAPGAKSAASFLPAIIEPLSEREREILALVGKGASNREVAEKLYLTEGTVKNHMTSILNKLGVRDRTQAALKAREIGLV